MNRSQRTRSGICRIGFAGYLAMASFANPSPALSQQPAVQPPAASPPVAIAPGAELLLSRLQAGLTLERYLENLRNDFFQLDADADGKLTQRDADLHALMEAIQLRTFAVNFVMRFDLDGDGVVTEDEIRRATRYELRTQLGLAAFNSAGKASIPAPDGPEKAIESTVRSIMALDADKDGKVTFSEASKFSLPGMQRGFGQNGQSARTRQALTLDMNSKGEITLADYQAAGEALFRKIDSDNDGKVSQPELVDYRRQPGAPDAAALNAAADAAQKRLHEQAEAARRKLEAAEAARAGCDMPAASEKAKVFLFGGYQTDALSSVTLGSQDSVIHAGRVIVEPGSDPLYVVISTYSPTIWQFSGAVERIERVVMSSSRTGPDSGDPQRPSLVGATGIPPERVSFFSRSNCLSYFYENPSSASLQTVATIRNATGKQPESVAAKYSVSSFAVPSGKIESLQDQRQPLLVIQKSQGTLNLAGNASNVIIQGGPSRARDDMNRFFPGGVIEIDPKTVVGSAPAAAYEVLPSQAGLVQLLSTGALTQNSAGEYIVRNKIRFPAGLAGAHSVTFLVMKGAPYPDGDPGHSCVVVEDTGESKGATCRRN
jgi:Ca2+-binding EF-hand superfamily protein